MSVQCWLFCFQITNPRWRFFSFPVSVVAHVATEVFIPNSVIIIIGRMGTMSIISVIYVYVLDMIIIILSYFALFFFGIQLFISYFPNHSTFPLIIKKVGETRPSQLKQPSTYLIHLFFFSISIICFTPARLRRI